MDFEKLRMLLDNKENYEEVVEIIENLDSNNIPDQVLFKIAEFYSLLGENSKSLEYLIKISSKNKKSYLWNFLVGHEYRMLNEYSSCEKYWLKAIKFEENEVILKALSLLYVKLGDENLKTGDFKKSEKYYMNSLNLTKKLKNSKNIIASNVKLANFYNISNMELEKVKFYLDECENLKEDEDLPIEYYQELAIYNLRIGDIKKSIEIFEYILKLKEDDIISIINLSKCYTLIGKVLESSELLERNKKYVNKDKKHKIELFMQLALNNMIIENYDLSLEQFLFIEKLGFKSPDLDFQIGLIFSRIGKPLEAIERFNSALEYELSKDFKCLIFIELARIKEEIFEYEDALESLKKANTLTKNNFLIQVKIANLNMLLGRVKTSLKYHKKAYELNPYDDFNLIMLSKVLMLLNNEKEAIELLNKQLNYSDNKLEIYEELINCYDKIGDEKKKMEVTKLLEIYSEDLDDDLDEDEELKDLENMIVKLRNGLIDDIE